MSASPKTAFDVIVVGGGHAGIEAALAANRMGMRTALVTLDKSHIGNMPCNPSIGGPAKGVVTREIDALGGIQAKAADATALQMKLLNSSKGPGVWALRCQSDKIEYKQYMLKALSQSGVTIIEGEVTGLLVDGKRAKGILINGQKVSSHAVILTTGTYLRSITMRGDIKKNEGPDGQKNAHDLSKELSALGFAMLRLKTGTPPRIKANSIDYSVLQLEPGTDQSLSFSHENPVFLPFARQLPCYLLHTTPATHALINENLGKCSLLNGTAEGVGARYCPSIEDKVVRFSDKPRHQLFVEPESVHLDTIYLGGFSTSMPDEIQDRMIRTLPGFANAVVAKFSYAIEYDAIDPIQLYPTLQTKLIAGLYTAGQLNGTSGYEEAACQGLIAGINAALAIREEPPFVLKRSEAYIGVLIDDLTSKGVTDPYRLLTSRAEHRLYLRNDNAEERLLAHGHRMGMVSQERYDAFVKKTSLLQETTAILKKNMIGASSPIGKRFTVKKAVSAYELLKRPEATLADFATLGLPLLEPQWATKLEIAAKFEGYIAAQQKQLEQIPRSESMLIPEAIDYGAVNNLALEAREKLAKHRPYTIGQASRISGITPADITMLLLYIRRLADASAPSVALRSGRQ